MDQDDEDASKREDRMREIRDRLRGARERSEAREAAWNAGEGAAWLYALVERVHSALPAPRKPKDREAVEYFVREAVGHDVNPPEPSAERLAEIAAKGRAGALKMRNHDPLKILRSADSIMNTVRSADRALSPTRGISSMLNPAAKFDSLLRPISAGRPEVFGSASYRALQGPSSTIKALQGPSSTIKALQGPSSTIKALQGPSSTIKALQGPSMIGSRSLLDSMGATGSVLDSLNSTLGTSFTSYDDIDETPVSELPSLSREVTPVKLPAYATRDDAQAQTDAVRELAVLFQVQGEAAELRHRQQMEAAQLHHREQATEAAALRAEEKKEVERRHRQQLRWAVILGVFGILATLSGSIIAIIALSGQ